MSKLEDVVQLHDTREIFTKGKSNDSLTRTRLYRGEKVLSSTSHRAQRDLSLVVGLESSSLCIKVSHLIMKQKLCKYFFQPKKMRRVMT